MKNGYIITAYRKDRPRNIFTMLQNKLIKLLEAWGFLVEEATGYTKEFGEEPVLVARASSVMSNEMDIAVTAIAAFLGQEYVLMVNDGKASTIKLEHTESQYFDVCINEIGLGLLIPFNPTDLPDHTRLSDGTMLTIVNSEEG